MEKKELSKLQVGTREAEKLTPKKVKILDFNIEDVRKKGETTVIGQKAVFTCKHPDREETIEISSVAFLVNKQVKTFGLWIKLDKDGNLDKSSGLSVLIKKHGANTAEELIGKESETELDEKGYLVLKSY